MSIDTINTWIIPKTYPLIISSPPLIASPIGNVTSQANSKPIGIIGIIMKPIRNAIMIERIPA